MDLEKIIQDILIKECPISLSQTVIDRITKKIMKAFDKYIKIEKESW